MLVARTLDQAMLSGHRLVLLVADPGYYEQFGCVPRGDHRSAQIHCDQSIELLEIRKRCRIAGEDVGAGIVHPRIKPAERLERAWTGGSNGALV